MKKTINKILNFVIIFVLLVSIMPQDNIFAEDTQPKSEEYVFRRSWGGEGERFDRGEFIAIDKEGIIYITRYEEDHITIFNPQDRTFRIWGKSGSGVGEFKNPYGITIDKSGNFYIADSGNHRIQKFNANREFLFSFGSYGSEEGQFSYPLDVAINQLGQLFISEQGNHRIQKFDQNGKFLLAWGSNGQDNGQFQSPRGISIDKYDNIYVADTWNHRIQKFSQNGNFLISWGSFGTEYGKFQYPNDVLIDENEVVYVTDFSNNRVQKFNINGQFLDAWYVNPSPAGISGITTDTNGNICIIDSSNGRILKYSKDGKLLIAWENNKLRSEELFNNPEGITISNNQIYLTTGSNEDRVLRFSMDGSFIQSWGGYGSDPGKFRYPFGVAADNMGNIYVADSNNNRIQKFSANGNFLKTWGTFGGDFGQFDSPTGITLDKNMNVYVADAGNHRIQKFTSDGSFLKSWGSLGGEVNQFDYPWNINFDGINRLFISDTGNYRIQVYDTEGNYIKSLDNQLIFSPFGIGFDKLGNILVVESQENRVRVYDSLDDLSYFWGSLGNELGQFDYPRSIDINDQGNAFITDIHNHRIQVFSPGLPAPDPYSGLALNGTFESNPVLTEWTYGGSLPVSRSTNASQGTYSLQLAQPVAQTEQGEGQAWAHQTFYVRPEWDRPILSFKYNMYVNDIMDYSDFFVAIQDGVGLNHLATVVRDGYQPCIPGTAPSAGTNLGWRSVNYDLSAYKGQHIRLVFSNRNLWPISWGIWTYVDDVKVVDAGPLPPPAGSESLYLPAVSKMTCDPVTKNGVKSSEQILKVPRPPTN